MAAFRSDDGRGAVADEQQEPMRFQRLPKDQVIAIEFSRPASRSQLLEKCTLIVGQPTHITNHKLERGIPVQKMAPRTSGAKWQSFKS